MSTTVEDTVWRGGRFDARRGPGTLLFGRMYEDASIELDAFRPGGRVLCIASTGCTAMALAPHREVVAVDINAVQLAYAARRFAGRGSEQGAAERFMAFAGSFAPLVGSAMMRPSQNLSLIRPEISPSSVGGGTTIKGVPARQYN